MYLELGAEVFRGSNYPAAGDADNGFGTQTLFSRFGGDVGLSNSWTAGISLSMAFDYPTGALIVWSMAIIAVAAAWVVSGLGRLTHAGTKV